MSNLNKFAQKMFDAGVCDARGAAFCATAVKLPDGSFGMVLMGVVGNELSLYDTDMKSTVGEHLYTIPLKEVTDLQITSGLLAEIFKGYSFKFTYDGFEWKFKNCAQQKEQLEVIRREVR